MQDVGLCRCGCGEHTPIATMTRTKWGHVCGTPVPYIRGHNRRKSGIEYVEEDRGYLTPCHIWQRTINPVTNAENTRRGDATKLSRRAVRDIRTSSESRSTLAERYGITPGHVSDIRRANAWADVGAPTPPRLPPPIVDRTPPNPTGLCQCGCGRMTERAKVSNRRNGYVAGEYTRYCKGHYPRIAHITPPAGTLA